jgi:hypothetical protein
MIGEWRCRIYVNVKERWLECIGRYMGGRNIQKKDLFF